jgi:flavin reductase (DIM6/NTAB) family NADH-FMN oxidoreductase RutF
MLLRLTPLIHECHANFECRLYDDALEDKYNFFVFEVVKAHVAASTKHLQTIHYIGDDDCSWSRARSSAESHCSGRGCCELIFEAFYDHILDEKTQLL